MQVKDQLSSLQPYKPGKSPEQMKRSVRRSFVC